MVKIITKYDYENRLSPGINFSPKTIQADRSMTNQADMDAADINKIMAKYEKTGVLIDPLGVGREPKYGDFTEVKNYHEMMIAVRNVENAFDTLPAKIKNRFDNDPQKLIDFLENRDNDDEAIRLGLREDPKLPPKEESEIPDAVLQASEKLVNDAKNAAAKLLADARIAADKLKNENKPAGAGA